MKRIEKQLPSTRRVSCFLMLLLCSSLALAACGQRGPLFLPENPVQDAPEATENDDDRQDDAQTSRS